MLLPQAESDKAAQQQRASTSGEAGRASDPKDAAEDDAAASGGAGKAAGGSESCKKRKVGAGKEGGAGMGREDRAAEWQPERLLAEYEAACKEVDVEGANESSAEPSESY
jgi:hypothetical protein